MTEVKLFTNNKIFLGGTCPNNDKDFNYRKDLIRQIDIHDTLGLDYFNPVVSEWNDKCIEIDDKEKNICRTHIYVITPNMRGVYSIAESFGSLIKYPNKRVILAVIKRVKEYDLKFNDHQLKSLAASGKLFTECGGEYYSFDDYYLFKHNILNILVED